MLSVQKDEMNDVMLHRVLLGKLGLHKNVSYRKIAQTAAKAGRNQLASGTAEPRRLLFDP